MENTLKPKMAIFSTKWTGCPVDKYVQVLSNGFYCVGFPTREKKKQQTANPVSSAEQSLTKATNYSGLIPSDVGLYLENDFSTASDSGLSLS